MIKISYIKKQKTKNKNNKNASGVLASAVQYKQQKTTNNKY